jgi:DNA polymerase III subunit alpha, Gram-positive type
MELVRKGQALKDPAKWAEYEAQMRECKVPEWYIDSCRKIKYMFPKAHAAAYVMMAFRIAWFKVHIPKAYYAAYFTIRAKAFDAEFMIFGKEKVKEKMKEIEIMGNQAAPKDKDMYDDLELVLEMYERDIKFLSIDLFKSHATKFLLEDDGIRPPINSISGMGTVAAEGIYNAAHEEKPLNSIEDLRKRAKIGNAAIDLLRKFGCLRGLPESSQMSFFDVI